MARLVNTYKSKKGGSVSVYFPAEADELLQWLEERSAKERKPMQHLVFRAIRFEQARIAELESRPYFDPDELNFLD